MITNMKKNLGILKNQKMLIEALKGDGEYENT
jgi:hypothetical protein